MKTDRIVQYIENNYGIKVADYKVVPRLMFRESLRIKSNECQYVVKKYGQCVRKYMTKHGSFGMILLMNAWLYAINQISFF